MVSGLHHLYLHVKLVLLFSQILCYNVELNLVTWLWCWEGLGAGGEGDDRGWDGWMASRTLWTWVSVNSGSWWWTGRPGVLWFMGSQRVRHATELKWILCGGTLLVFKKLKTISQLQNCNKNLTKNSYIPFALRPSSSFSILFFTQNGFFLGFT